MHHLTFRNTFHGLIFEYTQEEKRSFRDCYNATYCDYRKNFYLELNNWNSNFPWLSESCSKFQQGERSYFLVHVYQKLNPPFMIHVIVGICYNLHWLNFDRFFFSLENPIVYDIRRPQVAPTLKTWLLNHRFRRLKHHFRLLIWTDASRRRVAAVGKAAVSGSIHVVACII